jgi:hypothetical protein
MYLQLIQPNIDRAEKIAQPRQPTTGITILESTIWNFLFFYISPWKELEVRQFYSPWYDCTVLQFHLRALEGYLKTPKTVEDLSGFTLARENGECFNFVNSKGPYYLQEKRAAIAICRTRPAIAPYYTIVWINDTTIPDTRYLSANVNRTEFGTMSSFKVFLYLIDLALEEAVRTWNSAYQIVHENLNVTVSRTSNAR